MYEDQAGVRIDRPYRIECENMVGAFEHPAPAIGRLMLKVLQKAFVKAIGLEVSGFVEPVPVARNMVSRVEAQAGKNMCGDLGTFLGRARVDRVHTAEIRRQQAEEPQLAGDPQCPAVEPGLGISRRVGVDQLPDARHQIGGILGQQAVQEGRAGAREPRNKDRPIYRPSENCGRSLLFVKEPKQVRQEPHHIPAGRDPSDQT